MKTTSRIELYERLWVEPKRDVARSFGVTSDRLSRLCRRNNIPIPVQGFWNRGPEDRAALKVALPESERDWEISIEPSAGHVPDDQPAETLGIAIPERITRWHPLIRQTRHVLKDCSQDEHGRYRPGAGCLDILVTRASRQRAYRVMDTILRECDTRGWSVRLTEGRWPRTIVTVEGGEVAICLEEMLRRGTEMFTEEERRKGRYGMQLYPRFPSGRFVLKTDWPAEYGRRAWREGKRFSLEYVLRQFIEDLELAGIWRREADERAAKRAEVRRERERIRWELQAACRAEQARVDRLVAEATTWDTSERIRNYVRARLERLKASGADVSEESKTAQWATWALKQADRLDPIVKSPPSILDEKPETYWDLVGKGHDWKEFFRGRSG